MCNSAYKILMLQKWLFTRLNSKHTRGGGRQSNQVGLIDSQENIFIVKIKILCG